MPPVRAKAQNGEVGVSDERPWFFAEDDLWWRDVMECSACGGRFLNWGNATHLCGRTLWRVEPGPFQTTLVAQTPWMDWETMGMGVR